MRSKRKCSVSQPESHEAPFGAGIVRKRNEERRRGPWKEITDWYRRSHGRALIGDYDTVQ